MSDNVHKGHRQRMREKLVRVGENAFNTYELFEMLLYYVIPYKDTNPVSQRLFMRFGSLSEIFSASIEELTSVEGVGEATAKYIKALGVARDKIIAPDLDSSVILDTRERVGEYAVELLRGDTRQAVYLLTLDGAMRLISAERLYECDLSSAAVKPGEIAIRTVAKDAVGTVIVHSHPYGAPLPSEGDRATAELIRRSLSSVGVELLASLVVSGDKYFVF